VRVLWLFMCPESGINSVLLSSKGPAASSVGTSTGRERNGGCIMFHEVVGSIGTTYWACWEAEIGGDVDG
jgi:hypothetical protein